MPGLTGKELLLTVKEAILEEPKRLAMGVWVDTHRDNLPACGTVGCIAGWAVILNVTTPSGALWLLTTVKGSF